MDDAKSAQGVLRPTAPTARSKSRFRIAALVGAELTLFSVVAAAFWFQDLRYSLPAPRPKNWKAPAMGASPRLPAQFSASTDGRPIAFNFYNSACPCSRFNLDHVRRLAALYGSRVRFVLVMEGGTQLEQEGAFRSLNLEAEPCYDPTGKIALNLGVYATPQAVVVDSNRRLVYRGNYNLGRFCVDPRTEFVRAALENTTSGKPLPTIMAQPIPAYGCAISAVSTEAGGLP
jgi:uncharacterized protein DUF6436